MLISLYFGKKKLAPLDKTTPLCLENNQLTIQPIQTETMQISQNVEPPPLPESSSDNSMPISNELPKEGAHFLMNTKFKTISQNLKLMCFFFSHCTQTSHRS